MISADLVPAWCVRFMCPLVLIDLATTRRSMGWVETSSLSSFLTRRTNIGKPGSSHQIRRHRPCNGTGPAAEKKRRGEGHKRGGEGGYTVVVLERCVVNRGPQGPLISLAGTPSRRVRPLAACPRSTMWVATLVGDRRRWKAQAFQSGSADRCSVCCRRRRWCSRSAFTR
jgi:hypothetical protein